MIKFLDLYKIYLQVKTTRKLSNKIFKDLIKKKNKEISINFKKYKELNDELKMALIK